MLRHRFVDRALRGCGYWLSESRSNGSRRPGAEDREFRRAGDRRPGPVVGPPRPRDGSPGAGASRRAPAGGQLPERWGDHRGSPQRRRPRDRQTRQRRRLSRAGGRPAPADGQSDVRTPPADRHRGGVAHHGHVAGGDRSHEPSARRRRAGPDAAHHQASAGGSARSGGVCPGTTTQRSAFSKSPAGCGCPPPACGGDRACTSCQARDDTAAGGTSSAGGGGPCHSQARAGRSDRVGDLLEAACSPQ